MGVIADRLARFRFWKRDAGASTGLVVDTDNEIAAEFGRVPIDQIIGRKYEKWVAESRSEYLNNPLAKRAVENFTESVVGRGIRLVSRRWAMPTSRLTDDDEMRLKDAWREYMANVDYCGDSSEEELVELAMRSFLVDGEFLAELVRDPNDRYRYKLREIDPLCVPVDVTSADKVPLNHAVVNGIEFDEQDRPVAYLVARTERNHREYLRSAARRVPIADMVHIKVNEFRRQTRGIPYFASAIPTFNSTRQFISLTLKTAANQAKLIGALKQIDPEVKPPPIDQPTPGTSEADWKRMSPARQWKRFIDQWNRQAGLLAAPPGMELQMFQNTAPIQNFATFMETMQRQALGNHFPTTTGQYAGMNYISGRLSRMETNELYASVQRKLIDKLYRPLWREFLLTELLRPGYSQGLRPQDAMREFEFMARPFPHIQPKETAAANDVKLANRTLLLPDLVEAEGGDFDERLREQARLDAVTGGQPVQDDDEPAQDDEPLRVIEGGRANAT